MSNPDGSLTADFGHLHIDIHENDGVLIRASDRAQVIQLTGDEVTKVLYALIIAGLDRWYCPPTIPKMR